MPVKSKVKISQNFVALNFNKLTIYYFSKIVLTCHVQLISKVLPKFFNYQNNLFSYNNRMFSIKFSDPVIFSPFFPQRASLKNYGKNMENFPGSPKYDFKHWAYVRPIFKTKYHLSSWESLIPDYFDPIIKYNAVSQITWFYYTKEKSNTYLTFFPFFLTLNLI